MKRIDLTGQRFGKLVVVTPVPGSKWHCVCDCGHTSEAYGSNLRKGATRSCGCVMRMSAKLHSTTHGYASGRANGGKTRREYASWSHAKQRCHNPRDKQFGDYGARGITVCDRWRDSFAHFIADMGPCPPGLTLDRVNNSLGYEPGNCRWVDMGVQCRNKRGNVVLEAFGRSQTLAEWGRETGVKAGRIARRIAAGWTTERAIGTPVEPDARRRPRPTNGHPMGPLLTHHGQTMGAAQWSRTLGIATSTILQRIRLGWPVAEVLRADLVTPAMRRTNVYLTHQGRTLHLTEWARQAGMGDRTLAGRLKNGWTLERALTQPVR